MSVHHQTGKIVPPGWLVPKGRAPPEGVKAIPGRRSQNRLDAIRKSPIGVNMWLYGTARSAFPKFILSYQTDKMELPSTRAYVLPNRREFSDFVTRLFIKYYEDTVKDWDSDVDEDPCLKRPAGTAGTGAHALFPYQELIRDYLAQETPYDRVLLYHGLGSGKTCTSIAAATSLISENRTCWVLLPASLGTNFLKEVGKCGAPIFAYDNHWIRYDYGPDAGVPNARELADRLQGILGLSDEYMASHNRAYVIDPRQPSNWSELTLEDQENIKAQVEEILARRFVIKSYNGDFNSREKVREFFGIDDSGRATKNPFDGSVVIIDEVHNLVSNILNESHLKMPVYEALVKAKNAKMVFLSGTPMVNEPRELAYLFNMLRGIQEVFELPNPPGGSGYEPEKVLRGLDYIDTVENAKTNRVWRVTRDPVGFVNHRDASGNTVSVKYAPTGNPWMTTPEFVAALVDDLTRRGWPDLTVANVRVEALTAFPVSYKEFNDLFVDTENLRVKNGELFARRIQGLVSFFKGADPRTLPTIIDREDTLRRIEMSPLVFQQYQRARMTEIRKEAAIARFRSADTNFSVYRMQSRKVCNYAIPTELMGVEDDETEETDAPGARRARALEMMRAAPDRYFSKTALETYSPKFLDVLNNISEEGCQMVYSFFVEGEGLGLFGDVLKFHGYRQFKVKREAGAWVEQLPIDPVTGLPERHSLPMFAFFTGNESPDEREIYRLTNNNAWGVLEKKYPEVASSLRSRYGQEASNLYGAILKCLMVSLAGAEGVDLSLIRGVHIIEPHWSYSKIRQLLGRSVRICSASALPPEKRTVKFKIYLTIFNDAIHKNDDNAAMLRKKDTELKKYVKEYNPDAVVPFECATSDEHIYEIAFEKEFINRQFSEILQAAALDCSIHARLHSRGGPVQHCMRFDLAGDARELAYHSDIKEDATDSEMEMNRYKDTILFQKVRVKQWTFLFRPDTRTIYHYAMWDHSKRLLPLGRLEEGRLILEE